METNAESTSPVETTEVDSEVIQTPAADSAPAGTEAAASGDDTSNWTKKAQERYDTLTREKYEALSARDRERYRSEQMERELQELKAKAAAKTETVAPSGDFPTLEKYNWDEGKFNAAVAEHAARIAREQTQAEFAAERKRQQEETANKSWKSKESEFVKSKPDYETKVLRHPDDGGPVISSNMADAIRSSDMGPAIAYYLAENRDRSAAIAELSPIAQIREIGRIEAKLEAAKAPPKPPVSQAPAPAPTVTATEAVVEKDPSNMSDAEFAKWRRRQIAQRR